MSNYIQNITSIESLEAINASNDKVTIIDFWAPWCGPCRSLAPVLEAAATELETEAIIAKANVDENQALARSYNIVSIPTLIYLVDGVEVDRSSGIVSKETIIEKVRELQVVST